MKPATHCTRAQAEAMMSDACGIGLSVALGLAERMGAPRDLIAILTAAANSQAVTDLITARFLTDARKPDGPSAADYQDLLSSVLLTIQHESGRPESRS